MDEYKVDEYHKRNFNRYATMYILADVLEIFCNMHNINITYKDAINHKQRELIELKQEKQRYRANNKNLVCKNKCELRKEKLVNELNNYVLQVHLMTISKPSNTVHHIIIFYHLISFFFNKK